MIMNKTIWQIRIENHHIHMKFKWLDNVTNTATIKDGGKNRHHIVWIEQKHAFVKGAQYPPSTT